MFPVIVSMSCRLFRALSRRTKLRINSDDLKSINDREVTKSPAGRRRAHCFCDHRWRQCRRCSRRTYEDNLVLTTSFRLRRRRFA